MLWRKTILPSLDGLPDCETVRLMRHYAGDAVRAFNNRAADQVPVQLGDADGHVSWDPEATIGQVRVMHVDGGALVVIAEMSDDGDRLLAARPDLGAAPVLLAGHAGFDMVVQAVTVAPDELFRFAGLLPGWQPLIPASATAAPRNEPAALPA